MSDMPELKIPMPPTFASVEEERTYRKQRLAAGFRLFSRFGFDEGVAGHITARDPELDDHFWVNPFGMHFGHIKASDLILVNHHGEVVQGDRPVNTAAFAIHSQVHAARPDVVAAAHSHSTYGRALSTLGKPLGADHPGRRARSTTTTRCSTTTPASCSTSRRASASPTPSATYKAAILRNHGLLTVGHSVDEAVWWFITMERHLPGAAPGRGGRHAGADRSRDGGSSPSGQVGSHFAGWFSFQPLYERIVREQPDLLD